MTQFLVLFALSLAPALGCASASPSIEAAADAWPPLEIGSVTHVVEGPTEEEDPQNPGPYKFTLPLAHGGAPGVAERMNEAFALDNFTGYEITGSSYRVTFQRGRLLAIEVYQRPTCGSYCEQDEVSPMLFDTSTGATISECFDEARRPALTAHIEALRLAIAQSIIDDPDEEQREELHLFDDVLEPYFGDQNGGSATFSDTGVTFATDYNFPHYAKALEPAPPGMTWAEIAPYLTPKFRALIE